MIPYGRQSISQDDIDSVIEVLQSDYLTQGPAVPAFERAVVASCGATYGIATNSATGALHVACLALGIGPGDLVWTSPNTFVASSNCALYCGADVDFVDIDPVTYNLSVSALTTKLQAARLLGRLPALVIPVHFAGQSCDMKAVHALALEYGFRVIEDGSHAIGGSYGGGRVGTCRYSDIAVFSFHPVKIVTTAEGGMAVTQSEDLARRMALFRSHGITREPSALERSACGSWYYEQQELGFNYRMTDMQAALGSSQMTKLDEFVLARRAVAQRYDEALETVQLTRPWQHPDSNSSWHLYVVRVPATRRTDIFETLRAAGIGANVHYIPVYLQPYYARAGFRPGLCPEAERYYADAISLPLFPGLSDADQRHVVETLAGSLR